LIVPDAKHLIAAFIKEGCSLNVGCFLFKVLGAIQLDDQSVGNGTEIDYILSNGMLPAEFDSMQLSVA